MACDIMFIQFGGIIAEAKEITFGSAIPPSIKIAGLKSNETQSRLRRPSGSDSSDVIITKNQARIFGKWDAGYGYLLVSTSSPYVYDRVRAILSFSVSHPTLTWSPSSENSQLSFLKIVFRASQSKYREICTVMNFSFDSITRFCDHEKLFESFEGQRVPSAMTADARSGSGAADVPCSTKANTAVEEVAATSFQLKIEDQAIDLRYENEEDNNFNDPVDIVHLSINEGLKTEIRGKDIQSLDHGSYANDNVMDYFLW